MAWIADRRRACLVPLLLMLLSWCEAASAARPPEPEVARCIRQAARGKLWLEKTLWGLRDQEAGWIGAEILNKDGSHDLGPLQINSWWVPRIAALLSRREGDIRRWLRFDPCFNAEAARWIFLDALKMSGQLLEGGGHLSQSERCPPTSLCCPGCGSSAKAVWDCGVREGGRQGGAVINSTRPPCANQASRLFLLIRAVSVGERVADHRRQCFLGATTSGCIPGAQIVTQPLRRALDNL